MNKYPHLNLHLDHTSFPNLEDGYPYTDLDAVRALADYPTLVLKVTTKNLRDAAKGKSTSQDFMRALREAFGRASFRFDPLSEEERRQNRRGRGGARHFLCSGSGLSLLFGEIFFMIG